MAKEIIAWGFWSGIFWVIFSPIIIAFMWRFHDFFKKINDDDCGNPIAVVYWTIASILTAVFVVVFFANAESVIKCAVAPKLYLIEYLKNILTSK